MKTKRLYYLDSVRVFAMYLGIVLHVTLPMLPWYGDYEMKEGYGILLLFIHGFRMPLFMIISGFFSEMIIHRNGVEKFIDNRLRRIGLPYLVFVPLITVLFISTFFIGNIFVDWDSINITKEAKESKTDNEVFDHGHLWFMYFLLIFTFVYSAIIYFLKKININIKINYFLISMIPMSFFLLIFQPEEIISRPATDLSFFPHWSILGYYFTFFLFGALFFRLKNNGQNFIKKISKIQKVFYWIPIASFIICLVLSEYKIYLLGELFNFIYTWSSILVIVLIFYKFINRYNSKIKYLSDASYFVYIIHIPFIILLQGMLSSLEINHFIKFIMIIFLVTIFCIITYHFLVRNTLIGKLLNGKKSKEQMGV
jgi:glucans biosynthesis protein C